MLVFFSFFLMQSGNWKHGCRLREFSIRSTMKTGAADGHHQAGGSKRLLLVGKIKEWGVKLSRLIFFFVILTSVPGGPGGPGGPLREEKRRRYWGEELLKAVDHFYNLNTEKCKLAMMLKMMEQCWKSLLSFVIYESDDCVENQFLFEHKPE